MANKLKVYFILILLSLPSTSFSSEMSIKDIIESQKEEGSGPAVIISSAVGKLNPGSTEFHVVLYRYETGESRDRTGRQYLSIFSNKRGKFRELHRLLIGDRLTQSFSTVNFDEIGLITLSGLARANTDPLCCPSKNIGLQFFFSYGNLIPKAYES